MCVCVCESEVGSGLLLWAPWTELKAYMRQAIVGVL